MMIDHLVDFEWLLVENSLAAYPQIKDVIIDSKKQSKNLLPFTQDLFSERGFIHPFDE